MRLHSLRGNVCYRKKVVQSATLFGVETHLVSVEVLVSFGVPHFDIVGMPDTAIQEARERIRAAIKASGFSMPDDKIVVSLAPCSLKKCGSGFDLPIALGILAATKQIDPKLVENKLFVGELSLEGWVRPVSGLLAYALCAKRNKFSFVCSSQAELPKLENFDTHVIEHLSDLKEKGFSSLKALPLPKKKEIPDFSDISGHDVSKRALQIAAAGQLGVLMIGPPGSGKTMLATRVPGILPSLNEQEKLETALIHSVLGKNIAGILDGVRPFRSPHHSATLAGLVGGGQPIRPGEVSLAHNGVLFLDELAEFRPQVLQGIREPLETGEVSLTRADGNLFFPARFMLVAATNPCPCGYFGDAHHECRCREAQIRNYQSRIGGPLMDRIDIHLDVSRLPAKEVMKSGNGTSSETLREGVLRAQTFASWRKSLIEEDTSNSLKTTKKFIEYCNLDDSSQTYLEEFAEGKHLSGRAVISILRVARVIADMDESKNVKDEHIGEALTFRPKEGMGL